MHALRHLPRGLPLRCGGDPMNGITLTIDGQSVTVNPGPTILDAARKLGIDIPTFCFLEKCSPATSCLACLVNFKVNNQGRFIPSCATKAQPGMVLESETPV